MKIKTAGFIGLGLIGGSLAKAIRRYHPDVKILAYTPDTASVHRAYHEGIVNHICSREDAAFSGCDVIFLCAPVSTNISYLPFLKTILSPGCILTDVGSVKGEIHQAVAREGLSAFFIGGHPMAGSEKSGYENASDYLFENAYYILTPTDAVSSECQKALETFTASLGAIPMVLSCHEHDYITAAVSHLPHIVAATLVNAIKRMDTSNADMKTIAAGGFKDITRIASSSPVMWQQICLSNRESISDVLDTYIHMLIQAREMIAGEQSVKLYQMFQSSKDYRSSFADSANGPIKKEYSIYCDIVDESGAIAVIATLLAVKGISIRNIGIIHNREFEEGVLKIEFYDAPSAKSAAALLRQHRYIITER